MPAFLDSPDNFKKLDKGSVLDSIRQLPDQFEQAWNDIKTINVPNTCYLAHNIVVSGMGGSALGERVVDALIADKLRVPIEAFTEYHVPNYVDEKSLVIISSYSGNTEESLSAGKEALKKNAQIFVLATGGKLESFMKEFKLAGYLIDPKHNPSGQPRMALGYNVGSLIGLLSKCGFYEITEDDVSTLLSDMRSVGKRFDTDTPTSTNPAKKIAIELKGKVPILVSSEHLVGATHAFRNQINETAKTFSTYFPLPELCHHLLEGLQNPHGINELLHFVFIESSLYSGRVQKRYPVTKSVLRKYEIGFSDYSLKSTNMLQQVFELLSLGSFVQFYLAMLYGINPAPVPIVEYFKKELAKA